MLNLCCSTAGKIIRVFFFAIALLLMPLRFLPTQGLQVKKGAAASLDDAQEEPGNPPMAFPNQKGPIRIRNQFPLNLPFLGFLPEEQFSLSPGNFLLEINYSQVNTFGRSQAITAGRSNGVRTPFSEGDFDRVIAENPGRDQFFLDLETSRLSFLATYGVTDHFQVDIEVPFLSIGGGMLDNLVQEFHDAAGLGQSGRDTFPKNATTLALFLDGQKIFRSGFNYSGLGDVVVSAKVPLYEGGPVIPMLGARVAVKLPTGNPDHLLGSGNVDVGVNLTASKMFGASCLHFNLGAVRPGGWDLLPQLDPEPYYTLLVAWEIVSSANSNISYLVQDLARTSTFREATDSELGDVSHEISFGIKVDVSRNLRLVGALTENHASYNNSSDIGFHFGFATTFGG